MAKILLGEEMGMIIYSAIHDPEGKMIECSDSYIHFLEDLGDLITRHFGGDRGLVGGPRRDIGWSVAFNINEMVPADGGVFKKFDTDVIWKNGKEDD